MRHVLRCLRGSSRWVQRVDERELRRPMRPSTSPCMPCEVLGSSLAYILRDSPLDTQRGWSRYRQMTKSSLVYLD